MVSDVDQPISAAGVTSGSSKMPTLEEYGTNLTKLAEEVICLCLSVHVQSCVLNL